MGGAATHGGGSEGAAPGCAARLRCLPAQVFGEGVINDAVSVVLLGAVARSFPAMAEAGGADAVQTG